MVNRDAVARGQEDAHFMVDNLPMFAIVSIARRALGSTTVSACVFASAAAGFDASGNVIELAR